MVTIPTFISDKSEITDQNPDMKQYDRLTTLIQRFSLSVRSACLDDATLIVTARQDGTPAWVQFHPKQPGFSVAPDTILMAAEIDWGGPSNPLIAALPDTVSLDLTQDRESLGLVKLIQSELQAQRCGVDSVVNRLCEVLIVRMMRGQIEAGSTEPGLLAGLSDPRISRAIVAMHDRPGRAWRNDELSQIAGMSLSRFTEVFAALVGEPPGAYLRRWRLTLAWRDVARGDRIDSIARRYGYDSPEGFARAFKRHYGSNPMVLRHQRAA